MRLRAGATPDERTDALPPGSKTIESAIDAAASAAGKALEMGTCTFILTGPPRPQRKRRLLPKP
jgi:hypothetical protein